MDKMVLRGGSDAKSAVERGDCGRWFFLPSLPFPFLGAGFGRTKAPILRGFGNEKRRKTWMSQVWADIHPFSWRGWTDESSPRSTITCLETKL